MSSNNSIPEVNLCLLPISSWSLTFVFQFECKYTLSKHTKPINTLQFSKDARLLLSGGRPFLNVYISRKINDSFCSADDGILFIWDIVTGTLKQSISVVFNGPVSTAAWTPISPDRIVTTFAFGCADGTIFVYNQSQEDVNTLFLLISYALIFAAGTLSHGLCCPSPQQPHRGPCVWYPSPSPCIRWRWQCESMANGYRW